MSATQWNRLRKEALAALEQLRSAAEPKRVLPRDPGPIVPHTASNAYPVARFECAEQIVCPEAFRRFSLPVEEIARHPGLIEEYGDRLSGELPAALFPEDEASIGETVRALVQKGLSALTCDNVYGIPLSRRLGVPADGGFGLNVTNTQAIAAYETAGLRSVVVSFEASAQAIRKLGGTLPRGAIAYGFLPLMRLRRCPNKSEKGCGSCNGRPELIDRMGVRFPLLCHEKRYTTLLNSVPLDTCDRPIKGVDFHVLYFTRETPAEANAVVNAYLTGRPAAKERTNGLYGGTLL